MAAVSIFIMCYMFTSPHKSIQWNLTMKVTIGTTENVVYMEVSSIPSLNNTAMHYNGTGTGVLHGEVSFIQTVPNGELSLYFNL